MTNIWVVRCQRVNFSSRKITAEEPTTAPVQNCGNYSNHGNHEKHSNDN